MSLPPLVYAPRGFINSADALLLETEQIIRHARPGLTAEELAKMLDLSERTMHRQFKN
ncbi:AraC family transcriptional regulator [Pseudomonas ficuserectae]|nr:HTH domain-containing protein [Pseudomonas ficuserectae]KPX49469.1 AraC family transcriptional regulator [Pseudomonas ficuserectae]RMS34767.1 AraC family transcriptional regulator [Pseudomonas ficuserectae]